MSKKVIIIGGGVAGMSAASELIKRGFSVEVYEARGIPGGKARSVTVPNSGVGGLKDLPGEHGFRFFPRFYRNLPQTMKDTPIYGNQRSAYNNLVQASRELIVRADQPNVLTVARFPRNLADFKILLADVFAPIGLTSEEEHFAAERLWQIATSCKERRANDYERLGWWEYVEADRFSDNYRALFAVGFTRTLVEKYEVEKIRTIGDGYYVAAGVPAERSDHAAVVASMALDMTNFASQVHVPLADQLRIRIGINSGPVIAGVIGIKKSQHDLWGDAANVASRMESHGVPGRIQITSSTYDLIKDQFYCEPRGSIEIKGKGEMETWFLESADIPSASPEALS